MADTTTIEYDGSLLSEEQQKKIVKPLEDLIKGLDRQAKTGPFGRKPKGGAADDDHTHKPDGSSSPGIGKDHGNDGPGVVRKTLQRHDITREGLTGAAFEDTPIANMAGDMLAGGFDKLWKAMTKDDESEVKQEETDEATATTTGEGIERLTEDTSEIKRMTDDQLFPAGGEKIEEDIGEIRRMTEEGLTETQKYNLENARMLTEEQAGLAEQHEENVRKYDEMTEGLGDLLDAQEDGAEDKEEKPAGGLAAEEKAMEDKQKDSKMMRMMKGLTGGAKKEKRIEGIGGGLLDSLGNIGEIIQGLKVMWPLILGTFSSLFGFFGSIFAFAKTWGPIIFKFATVGVKGIPVIGWIVMAIQGLIHGIMGFIDGFKEGGLIGGLIGGISGIIHGIIDVPLNILKDLLSWILGMFGLDAAAEFLDSFEFDFGGWFKSLANLWVDMWGAVFDVIMYIPNKIKEFVAAALSAIGVPDWLNPFMGDEEEEAKPEKSKEVKQAKEAVEEKDDEEWKEENEEAVKKAKTDYTESLETEKRHEEESRAFVAKHGEATGDVAWGEDEYEDPETLRLWEEKNVRQAKERKTGGGSPKQIIEKAQKITAAQGHEQGISEFEEQDRDSQELQEDATMVQYAEAALGADKLLEMAPPSSTDSFTGYSGITYSRRAVGIGRELHKRFFVEDAAKTEQVVKAPSPKEEAVPEQEKEEGWFSGWFGKDEDVKQDVSPKAGQKGKQVEQPQPKKETQVSAYADQTPEEGFDEFKSLMDETFSQSNVTLEDLKKMIALGMVRQDSDGSYIPSRSGLTGFRGGAYLMSKEKARGFKWSGTDALTDPAALEWLKTNADFIYSKPAQKAKPVSSKPSVTPEAPEAQKAKPVSSKPSVTPEAPEAQKAKPVSSKPAVTPEAQTDDDKGWFSGLFGGDEDTKPAAYPTQDVRLQGGKESETNLTQAADIVQTGGLDTGMDAAQSPPIIINQNDNSVNETAGSTPIIVPKGTETDPSLNEASL